MTTIALGYTLTTDPPTIGLRLVREGSISILTIEDTSLKSERLRLAALQACFDKGFDLLPFAVRYPVSFDEALDHARTQETEIRQAFDRIRGAGQLVLSVRKKADSETFPRTGREWLLDRRQKQDSSKGDRHQLEMIAKNTVFQHSVVTESRAGLNLALLIPRHQFEAAKRILQKKMIVQPFGERLVLSGLWPPFAFSNLATEAEIHT